jgi:hypothetical protein
MTSQLPPRPRGPPDGGVPPIDRGPRGGERPSVREKVLSDGAHSMENQG